MNPHQSSRDRRTSAARPLWTTLELSEPVAAIELLELAESLPVDDSEET